ncbi:hypothetical protein [Chroococcidiopsis sp. CCALA 051]|nr:hypothetical protein [Chroococcidiopsis sp. CCALA 051]
MSAKLREGVECRVWGVRTRETRETRETRQAEEKLPIAGHWSLITDN